jgi:hypothetical protein
VSRPDAATVAQWAQEVVSAVIDTMNAPLPYLPGQNWDWSETVKRKRAIAVERVLTLHAQAVAQAVREEREACARIAEYSNGEDYEAIANAIRARGPQVGQLDNTWLCQAPFPCPCPMCQGPQEGTA